MQNVARRTKHKNIRNCRNVSFMRTYFYNASVVTHASVSCFLQDTPVRLAQTTNYSWCKTLPDYYPKFCEQSHHSGFLPQALF